MGHSGCPEPSLTTHAPVYPPHPVGGAPWGAPTIPGWGEGYVWPRHGGWALGSVVVCFATVRGCPYTIRPQWGGRVSDRDTLDLSESHQTDRQGCGRWFGYLEGWGGESQTAWLGQWASRSTRGTTDISVTVACGRSRPRGCRGHGVHVKRVQSERRGGTPCDAAGRQQMRWHPGTLTLS